MSDPEVPDNEQPAGVDDVVGSANEGLDAAAAARADVAGTDSVTNAVDPDLAAFEAAEQDYPGTFGGSRDAAADAAQVAPGEPADASAVSEPAWSPAAAPADEPVAAEPDWATAPETAAEPAAEWPAPTPDERTAQWPVADDAYADRSAPAASEEPLTTPTVADTAYASEGAAAASAAQTQVVPSEPYGAAAPQPIFVQAPEAPRELGNRGAAGAIGLIATVCFAVLSLGAIIGLGALNGDVTGANIGTAALAPLTTWSFWVPVVVFFLAFWLLGAFVNRARWGKWVIFGLLVAAATYGGHLLGQLFQAPFWRLTATESVDLVSEQLLAPLAIAAFLFARELTIWFGAWVAKSGARKKVLNAEAQAEYERTLEAGPAALR
ncbi:hypothetical protein FM104_05080 [Microbacterium esteraromaticum]|uniref:Uncharacterized protein n=1 Tax=Microbacterium esteraromaticum TaxID=57043 RepID=A0A1R4J2Y5_9MICO|nr:hypothetical protein [Microbacterium esteraromaticum]SJN26043.1 hypothetical protein FM104_05080 [Microbacterium esteraromaticum]